MNTLELLLEKELTLHKNMHPKFKAKFEGIFSKVTNYDDLRNADIN